MKTILASLSKEFNGAEIGNLFHREKVTDLMAIEVAFDQEEEQRYLPVKREESVRMMMFQGQILHERVTPQSNVRGELQGGRRAVTWEAEAPTGRPAAETRRALGLPHVADDAWTSDRQ